MKPVPKSMTFVMFLLLVAPSVLIGGQYTTAMINACPKAWEMPVYKTAADFSDDDAGKEAFNKYIKDNFGGIDADVKSAKKQQGLVTNLWSAAGDRSAGKDKLSGANVIETISPASLENLTDDPLTVASECLVYLNMEIDTILNPPPAPEPQRSDLGWLVPIIAY